MTASYLTAASIVVRRDDALSADVGGRTVLMSLEQGKYYDFDAIGSDIWERLASPTSVSALCAALSARYAGEPTVIQTDVLALLATLVEQGLIEIRPGDA